MKVDLDTVKRKALFMLFIAFAVFIAGVAYAMIFKNDSVFGYTIIQPSNSAEELALNISFQLNLSQSQTLQLMDIFNSAMNRTANISVDFSPYATKNDTANLFNSILNQSDPYVHRSAISQFVTNEVFSSRLTALNGTNLQSDLSNQYQKELLSLQANITTSQALLAIQQDYQDKLRGGNLTIVDMMQLRSNVDEIQKKLTLGKYAQQTATDDLKAQVKALQDAQLIAYSRNIQQPVQDNTTTYIYTVLAIVVIIAWAYTSGHKSSVPTWFPQQSSRPIDSPVNIPPKPAAPIQSERKV